MSEVDLPNEWVVDSAVGTGSDHAFKAVPAPPDRACQRRVKSRSHRSNPGRTSDLTLWPGQTALHPCSWVRDPVLTRADGPVSILHSAGAPARPPAARRFAPPPARAHVAPARRALPLSRR